MIKLICCLEKCILLPKELNIYIKMLPIIYN